MSLNTPSYKYKNTFVHTLNLSYTPANLHVTTCETWNLVCISNKGNMCKQHVETAFLVMSEAEQNIVLQNYVPTVYNR
jgi:hypothetical protein